MSYSTAQRGHPHRHAVPVHGDRPAASGGQARPGHPKRAHTKPDEPNRFMGLGPESAPVSHHRDSPQDGRTVPPERRGPRSLTAERSGRRHGSVEARTPGELTGVAAGETAISTRRVQMEIITITPKLLLGAVLAVLVVVIVLAVCSRANGEDDA